MAGQGPVPFSASLSLLCLLGKELPPVAWAMSVHKAKAREEWEGRVWGAEASFVWHQTELMLEPAARADPRMDPRKEAVWGGSWQTGRGMGQSGLPKERLFSLWQASGLMMDTFISDKVKVSKTQAGVHLPHIRLHDH